MKTRFGVAVVIALMGFAVPASADTIADFSLDNVTFDDDGTAAGTFTLDLTTSTLSNVNITTSDNLDSPPFGIYGATYSDSSSNTFTNGTTAAFDFFNGFLFEGTGLELDVGGSADDASLTGSPSLGVSGSETNYFIFCDFFVCGSRNIDSGTLDVTSLTVAATPLPAALPLFAGGLGMLGWVSRRRKRKGGDALAAA